jgi:archaellum component FlaC
MSNYEELPDDIRKQIGDFEAKIGGLKVLKGSAREEAVARHEKHAKRIRRLLETYQYSIQSGSF